MKYKLKKWLIRIGVFFLGVFLFGYCPRDFWGDQINIYLAGLVDRRTLETGPWMPHVDEIEIMSLRRMENIPADADKLEDKFVVTARKTIRGSEVDEMQLLWRGLLRSPQLSDMCHNPPYALCFRAGGKTLLITTICWNCSNYTIPMGIFGGYADIGFNAGSPGAQRLLAILKAEVPWIDGSVNYLRKPS